MIRGQDLPREIAEKESWNNESKRQEKIKIKNKSRDTTYERETNVRRGLPVSILGIVFVLLIVALLFARFRNNEQTPTFTSLLEWFSGFEAPEIPFLTVESVATLGDWTPAFNWLRDIVYTIIQLLNVAIFLCNGLVIATVYIAHFCRWLFMV